MRRRLVFDCDGVVTDIGQYKRQVAHALFGVDIPVSECRHDKAVGKYLTAEQNRLWSHETYQGARYFPLLRLMPDAAHYLQRIENMRHELLIVTRRTNKGLALMQHLLLRQGLKIELVGVPSIAAKAEYIHGADHYVDDESEALRILLGQAKQLWLFSQPYNLTEAMPLGVQRISSWANYYYLLVQGDSSLVFKT